MKPQRMEGHGTLEENLLAAVLTQCLSEEQAAAKNFFTLYLRPHHIYGAVPLS